MTYVVVPIVVAVNKIDKVDADIVSLLLVLTTHTHALRGCNFLCVSYVYSSCSYILVTIQLLSMDVHVATVCRSGYYQLRQVRPLTRSLTTAAAETVVHAFVASRLDYCNALLYLSLIHI